MNRLVTVSEQVGVRSVDEAIEAAYRLAEKHGIKTILSLEAKAGLGTDTGRPLLWEVEVSGRVDAPE